LPGKPDSDTILVELMVSGITKDVRSELQAVKPESDCVSRPTGTCDTRRRTSTSSRLSQLFTCQRTASLNRLRASPLNGNLHKRRPPTEPYRLCRSPRALP
jgi:hypothetical protein